MSTRHIALLALSLCVLQACGGGGSDVSPNNGDQSGTQATGDQGKKPNGPNAPSGDAKPGAPSNGQNQGGQGGQGDQGGQGTQGDQGGNGGNGQNPKPQRPQPPRPEPGSAQKPSESDFAKVPDDLVNMVMNAATMRLPVDFRTPDNATFPLVGKKGSRFTLIQPNMYHKKVKYENYVSRTEKRIIETWSGNFAGFAIFTTKKSPDPRKELKIAETEVLGSAGYGTTNQMFDDLGKSGTIKYLGIARGYDNHGDEIDGQAKIDVDLGSRTMMGKILNVPGIFGVPTVYSKKSIRLAKGDISLDNRKNAMVGRGYAMPGAGKGNNPYVNMNMSYALTFYGPKANEIAGFVTDGHNVPKIGVHATRMTKIEQQE